MLKPKNRVVIIGVSGMVGGVLKEKIKSLGFEVVGVARSKSDINGDVADYKFLNRCLKNGDVVYYLATENKSKKFIDYWKVNVLGVKNLVKIALKKQLKKIVYVSTTMVLGMKKKSGNFYADTKFEGLKYFKRKTKKNFYIIYPGVVINRDFRYRAAEKTMAGKIKDFWGFNTQGGLRMMAGDENRHFEMIYIDELVDMLAAYLEKRMPVEIKAVTNNFKVKDYVKTASLTTRFWPFRVPGWISKFFLN